MAIITLLSDFGLKDSYVAEMKGVILSISPDTKIIDITHKIEEFDIEMGMFVLASAARYFPDGTIHVAVVDPGVGGKRRPILIKAKRNYYIGPDNGVLTLAAKNEGIENVYCISKVAISNQKISATFHGRDIFAYTAALVAERRKISSIGERIDDYLMPEFKKVKIIDNEIICEIIHIDGFGNLITNIFSTDLYNLKLNFGSNITLQFEKNDYSIKFYRTYSDAHPRELFALIGSHNYLEIAENYGSAKNRINAKKGDKLKITFYD
jgi:S-adenosylmethionine hydrolase